MNTKDLFGFLKFLQKDHVFVGPVRDNGILTTKIIDDLDELEFTNEIPLHSFKNFLLPREENLLEKRKKTKMAFVGLGILDLKAITILNQVFEKDPYYQDRLKNSLFIGYSQFPCEYKGMMAGRYEEDILEHLQFDIFIVEDAEKKSKSIDGKSGKINFDLMAKTTSPSPSLPRKGKKEISALLFNNYRILTGSEKGQKIMDKYGIEDYDHVQFSGPIKEEGVEKRMINIRAAIKKQTPQGKIFSELGQKCIECGRCSLICPLCYCFCVKDEPNGAGNISRFKTSTTCFYSGFSQVAGGHKFLRNPAERIFNWYEHKFVRLPDELSLMGCVGCGRCAKVCPAGIHLKDVLEELVSES